MSSGEQPILPRAGSMVRLRCDGHDRVVEVAGAEEGAVRLRIELGGGPAQIVFSSPRGVVGLSGELEPSAGTTSLRVSAQEWLAQRRETFRLAVGCAMTLVRRDRTRIDGTVTDLSVGGALLGKAAKVLALDERIELFIDLGDGDEVKVAGTVVRCDGPRRAMHFDPLPADVQTTLERFLAREQQRRLRRR